jgi:hypothetical protein
MSWIISFHIIGDKFDPNKINVEFNNMNLSSDIAEYGKFKGKEYGYGSAVYVVPKDIPRLEKFKHLADLFEPIIDELTQYGAENWWIDIGRLYAHQCNEELDFEEIKQIARLKCSLSYSAYSVSEEEEIVGFDYENYGK